MWLRFLDRNWRAAGLELRLDSNFRERLAVDLLLSTARLDLRDLNSRLPNFNPDRYRLVQPKADLLMARSLAKYGQLAPVVYCQLEGSLVLVDGFKRLRAARTLKALYYPQFFR